jgi:hypothetical protein
MNGFSLEALPLKGRINIRGPKAICSSFVILQPGGTQNSFKLALAHIEFNGLLILLSIVGVQPWAPSTKSGGCIKRPGFGRVFLFDSVTVPVAAFKTNTASSLLPAGDAASVPADPLGPVERLVGLLDELLRCGLLAYRQRCHAEAHGN